MTSVELPSRENLAEPTARRAPLLGVAVVVILVGLVPLLALGSAQRLESPPSVVAVWMVMAYAGVRIGMNLVGTRIRPIETVSWIFGYLWFGLAPLAQLVTGIFPKTKTTDFGDEAVIAALVVLAGMVAYDIGLRLARRDGRPVDRWPRRILHRQRLIWLSLISLVAAGVYAMSVGIGTLFASRQQVAAALQDTGVSDSGQSLSAILTALGLALPFVCFLAWSVQLAVNRRDRRVLKGSDVLWWIVLLGVNLIVNNPIAAPRNWLGTIIIALFFAWPGLTVRAFRMAVPIGIVILAVAFPYLDYFRVSATTRTIGVQGTVLEAMATKDFDAFGMLMNALTYVQERGIDYGGQVLGAVLFWLPRAVWPAKPLDSGAVLGRFIEAPNVNLSAPLQAEAVLALGVVAVPLLLLVVGFVSRRGDDAFGRVPSALAGAVVPVAALAVPIFAGYQLIILRGSLLQAMGRAAAIAVILVVLAPREGVRARGQEPVGHPLDRQVDGAVQVG